MRPADCVAVEGDCACELCAAEYERNGFALELVRARGELGRVRASRNESEERGAEHDRGTREGGVLRELSIRELKIAHSDSIDALKPDVEKMLAFAAAIRALRAPHVVSAAAQAELLDALQRLEDVAKGLEETAPVLHMQETEAAE